MGGWNFDIEPAEAIRKLRECGLDLFVGNDGMVHGRFREKGQRMTLEMQTLADALQARNDEAVALLRAEARHEYKGITVEEAMALGEKVRAGEMELDGKVIYHQSTGLCDLTLRGGHGHGQDTA
jgi:hypothetical protein